MFRKKLTLQVEPVEQDVFSPNKDDVAKKEFKSHIQKPKGRKPKINSSTIL
jgi:hypothetical protein